MAARTPWFSVSTRTSLICCGVPIWGGTSGDGAFGLKVSSSGQVVVTGGTASSGFPVTAGTWTTSYAGGTADGFVSILSADGSSLVASTYAGTSQYDQSYFVELDEYDNVHHRTIKRQFSCQRRSLFSYRWRSSSSN